MVLMNFNTCQFRSVQGESTPEKDGLILCSHWLRTFLSDAAFEVKDRNRRADSLPCSKQCGAWGLYCLFVYLLILLLYSLLLSLITLSYDANLVML